ncbi:hypothetical protein FACS189421_13350 [Bacteroidia bacterium]|nr:hypothetical protein FACS189421_13350 [Bacteroidia bacterium]
MKKTIKIIAIIFTTIFFLLIGLDFSSNWLFPEWSSGSYDLGNNLYMMEWDGGGRIIVHCSRKKGKACYGGTYVVPTHKAEYDSLGNWAELVDDAKFDKKWIIVKSKLIQEKKYCYYIINKDFDIEGLDWEKVNCDSIIQSHIIGPLDSITFSNELEQHKIDLDFSN